MLLNRGYVGTQLCATAAGVVIGVAGKPTRIYHINVLSGATAGIVKLYNVSAVADIAASKLYLQETCTAVSTGNDFDYGQEGILFPNGAVITEVVDANVVSAVVTFEQET
jgi:hypothetical protein